MARHNETGALGEHLVATLLRQARISVAPSSIADLRVEGVEIEVKTARPSFYRPGRRGFQFSLERRGHSQLRAQALVLVALQEAEADGDELAVFFVIPAAVVAGRRKLAITNHDALAYSGRWSAYRGRWETIAEAA